MTHLVIVEGITDKGVVQEIAKKIKTPVEILIMRGNNPNKAIRLIKAKLTVEKYNKVIVLKDLHQQPEDKIREKLNKIANSIDNTKVHGIIVRKAIEAWILAGIGETNPENIDKPEELLDHIMRLKGRRYIKSLRTAKELTRNIDLQKAIKNSQTLRQLIEILKDP